MQTPIRHLTTIAFDFSQLFRASDDAVLQRFRFTRKVNPGVVPKDFQPDGYRIHRDLDAITLQFFRRQGPDDPGTEILRFSFKPAE
jgi:hypothetical protein